MRVVKLEKLLNDLVIPWKCSSSIPDCSIQSIQFDSRKVQPGDLFVAITGETTDGHDYIDSAVRRGAAVVLGSREISVHGIPYIRVEDSREALAYLAASFYDHPARKLMVIGVTGTDGKTTTSTLIFNILRTAGIKAGMITTVNAVIGDEQIDTGFHVTTPEAIDIQRYLALMVDSGLTTVVLETTSHGLAQHRVTGCEYDIAVVTNITHEHLDYHGTYENYRAAKGRMFKSLEKTSIKKNENPRLAILNRDDQSYEYLDSIVTANKITYGLYGKGDLTADEIHCSASGVDFTVYGMGSIQRLHCNLPGSFNVANCLAALAVAKGLGISLQIAAQGIAAMQGVPGRMETITMGQPFTAIVDFAHTPNALQKAIVTAREMTKGRVITIFGSAGLRDRQKRRMMAEVSIALSDITILTAEDPRTESLDAILAQMADAAEASGGIENQNFYRVPDRGDAIRLGVKLARPGDLLMACGKGHEQSMCFDTKEYFWDDRIAMRAALSEMLKMSGPAMPSLPTS